MPVDAGSLGTGAASGAAAGSTFGPWGAVIGGVIGAGTAYANSQSIQSQTGTTTVGKTLSQDALNSIIYNIMSSDQGLSALASGENTSGGFHSSTKGLMAQDLTTKLAGEIANITAPTVQDTSSKSSKKSVICTHLMQQGYLDPELYYAGTAHFCNLPYRTVAGYQIWGIKVVTFLEKYPVLCKFIAPIALSRYNMIVYERFGILGAITIYLGQPLCYLIGTLTGAKDHGGSFHRSSN